MRILVFGYHEIGYLCLKYLLENKENVVGLFTYSNNPDEKIWFKTPDKIAEKYNIPLYYDADLKSPEIKKIITENMKPDLVFSFYFREKIPEYILDFPANGAINIHGAYLPAYRGCAPLNWALVNGETYTGVTFHYMDKNFDTGDIIAQQKISISQQDDIISLYKKFFTVGLELFRQTYPLIKTGNIKTKKQNPDKASYFSKRSPDDGKINWQSMTAEQIYNLVRALTDPYPGAFTYYNNNKIIFWKSEIIKTDSELFLEPGQFIFNNGVLRIGTIDKKIIKVTAFTGNNIPDNANFD